ncbi:MAG TPA: cyclic peptide export ABC transporter [Pyrinomonadaceae bacterium]|nr:cyclic peptide export ABC transporter [Pyrinomonadaceae bacterium]
MIELSKVVILLLRLTKDIAHSRALVAIIILAGLISGLSNTLLIATINSALNNTAVSTSTLVLTFIALCLALAVMRFVSGAVLAHLMKKVMVSMRLHLSNKILNAPLRLLEQLGSHRLIATLNTDVPAIANAYLLLPLLCMNFAILLGCLIYLCWLSPLLLIAALVFMTIGIISHQLPVMKAMQYFTRAREATDLVSKHQRGLIEGIKELKLHRRRRNEFYSELVEPHTKAMEQDNATGSIIWAAAGSWGQVLFFIFIGLVLFVAPALNQVNSMVLTGYTLTVMYMMGPLEFMLNFLPNLTRANVAMKKIETITSSLDEQLVMEATTDSEVKPSWNLLELSGIQHSYRRENEEAEFSLGPIDLSIRPGELVFITGGNGSGKTTLAKLLVGLYIPQQGEIRLDGQPITDERRDNYRQLFSVVFSDFYLFENLLGLNNFNIDTKAQDYLVKLQLDRCVQIKDRTLSTLELSQGQRKRLALLTAYLEDRSIYVFDEWAADQDPQFKEIFYFELLGRLKEAGKTVIVISHDDRYYHVADRVLKLNYGLIEFDNPIALSLEDKVLAYEAGVSIKPGA